MLIDTHCHLNLVDAFPDPEQEIAHAASMDVERMVVIGIDLETSERAIELAKTFPGVFATVGIHPNSSSRITSTDWNRLNALARSENVVAIGEIGLDYYWDHASRAEQFNSLDRQLDLAEELDKPIVLHCREAYGDLLDILESKRPQKRLVMHCFSGNQEDAVRAIDLGCYFGVDGPLTYKNAETLRKLVATLPKDKVLIETDAPYLTPVPHRGKPNRPGFVAYINSMLASIWGLGVEETAHQTSANAERFFALAKA